MNSEFLDYVTNKRFELPVSALTEKEIRHAASEDAFNINVVQSMNVDAMDFDVDLPTTDLSAYAPPGSTATPSCSSAPPLKSNCILAYQSSFDKVIHVINGKLQELVSMTVSFAYFASEQIFRVKFLSVSNSREVHIMVFFDSSRGDHVVEVQRVAGDGLFDFKVDLLSLFQSIFNPSSSKQPSTTSTMAPNSSYLSTLPPLANVEFVSALFPLLQMAENYYFETRLEAAKMLCEVFNQSSNVQLLVRIENRDTSLFFPCLRVILKLLQDTANPEIVEFATVAVSLLIDQLVSLQLFDALRMMILEFRESGDLDLASILLTQILGEQTNMPKEEKYSHVLRRRNVAKSLALISQHFSTFLVDILQSTFAVTSRMDFARLMDGSVEDKWEEIWMMKVCDHCYPRQ